ncbi:MAG: GntR family transcriptional regulator [Eubacterium sp.]|nr:GntR family transcriptional regulator [Eubacterium sp.]MDD7210650.1 GntR family transcriptional regulator [Lachnospiraceae bacterium]MDY5496402.1 GntR family transcriptional regulator [Anaerobutyricum sp.]
MQPGKIQKNNLKTLVREELENYIHHLDLAASNKLPREETLAKMLGVSRITLRSVLDDMAAEGIIFRQQGRGTFVNPVFFEINVSFNPVMHFSDMIRNSGYEPHTEIIYQREETAEDEIARKLKIPQKSPVLVCARFFYADDNICAMTTDYVPEEKTGPIDLTLLKECSDSIFYYIYKKTGHKIVCDKVELDVADSREVSLLHKHLINHGRKDKPYLLLNGVNYTEDNEEILYSREYVDTSILKFSQIRKRSISYEEKKRGRNKRT